MLLLLIMKPRKVLKYHSFLYGLGKLVVETNDGIRGYKSEQLIRPGYFTIEVGPYIPMVGFSTTEEFRPRRSLMSRYAKKMVNNSFYGTIQHDGA